ncbi:hypothetical protein EVX74_018295 (plasmid) [Acinetobacter lwoffii]|uniref:HNH domain-containing protein n=1 Tax=Acinetobacter lwoffii TaxID=28090 RepID=A0AAJ4P8U1_ACILW|nr:hypothetical protein EVX74_018295 [Acinetobacter lwoffii]
MPDIKNQISFTVQIKKILREKLKDTNFKYTDWSDESLEETRKLIREFYRNEQNGKCAYCRQGVSLQSASNAHVEHILPKSKHLKFIFEPKNLCVICADCNEIKREKEALGSPDEVLKKKEISLYPRSSKAFIIVHPHFDNYHEHIRILVGGEYVDRTPKGNVTIGICKLNRFFHKFGWPDEPSTLQDILQTADKILKNDDPLSQIRLIKELASQINSNADLLLS